MSNFQKNCRLIHRIGLLFFVFSVFYSNAAEASETVADVAAPVEVGSLVGRVTDAKTSEALGWTTLLLEELHRSVSAHSDGEYHLVDIPVGTYSLKIFRVGYQDASMRVTIESEETTEQDISLVPAALFSESIIVESRRADNLKALDKPDIDISGKKLRQNLGRTIAETIDYEAGVSQRTMGPAPARPVLRGLGGDRLLVLEDGERTGDLSATSSDHAVVVDPINAERIEVIRGPESLIYGSSTLGGVVNVIREYVPSNLPHRLTGSGSLQGETVNGGLTSGANITAPAGPLAIHADGSIRSAGNVATPEGTLKNTAIATKNASLGMGYYQNWGFIGSAANYYETDYGIPPDPFGGHPNGVDVDIRRRHLDTRAEIFPDLWEIGHLEFHHTYSRYEHSEREASGAIGMEFGVITHNFSAVARLKSFGRHGNGAIGLWGEHRDYASAGLSFTPNAVQQSYAAFVYQELHFGEFQMNASLRYDFRSVKPEENRYSKTVGFIRDRNFDGIAGAVSGKLPITDELAAGATIMKSFRAPGIEELFSEGPHLAAYSYEVGNSELKTENGIGLEAFLDLRSDKGTMHLAVYQNHINGYIFPRNTGQLSSRRADLFLYRFSGRDARMRGLEMIAGWKINDRLTLNGSLNYIRGKLLEDDQDLPQIPPLEGKLGIHYAMGSFSLGSTLRAASSQDKTGEFEKPTNGYSVVDISMQYMFSSGFLLHTFALNAENVFDTAYSKHLNRVKEIMPEAGRNIKLLYKMYF